MLITRKDLECTVPIKANDEPTTFSSSPATRSPWSVCGDSTHVSCIACLLKCEYFIWFLNCDARWSWRWDQCEGLTNTAIQSMQAYHVSLVAFQRADSALLHRKRLPVAGWADHIGCVEVIPVSMRAWIFSLSGAGGKLIVFPPPPRGCAIMALQGRQRGWPH